jgi:hypothetical protein
VRRPIGFAVLCALALTASLVAYEGPADLAFDVGPSPKGPIDPSGQWDRIDGPHLSLLISHDPRGAWIVESRGEPSQGQPGNACWRVHAGSLNEAELVTTSDANRDLKDTVARDTLASYQGLFVEFKGERAKVTGPESGAPECPLAGVYIRNFSHPNSGIAGR